MPIQVVPSKTQAFYENLISEEEVHKSNLTKSTSAIAKSDIEPKQGGTVITKFDFDARGIPKLAKTIGASQAHIYRRLNFLYLPEAIQTMLDNEKI